MTILGGLDLGTSGCKLSVYDDGGLIARARAAYPATRSGGRHSLDANAVWRAAKSLFREVIGNNRRVAAMEAVSVSSFGEAGVPLDARGMVLGESALFSDARGGEEAAGIAEKLGDDRIRFLCGVAPHPMYTVCKL
ncbi:MAG: hypothetical protein LBE84_03165, partial [Planctomycetota bacterium]|nr:hypothetical protein [Planctomycetota bacterium]